MKNDRKYDVALSFAGEDREYVSQVAELLKARGVKVFYDLYEESDLWGKNLYVHLQDVYQNQATYTVIFISQHYAKKAWTNHERESAQARAFKENTEYILPARFDDTEVPGVLTTMGYVDLKKKTPKELVDLIEKKLERRESFWKSEAEKAAEYMHNHYFFAHRGAILWCPQVTVVFGNDGYDPKPDEELDEANQRSRDEVAMFRKKSSALSFKELGFGKSKDGYSWAILIDSSEVERLHELVWSCYPPGGSNNSYQKTEATIGLQSYWTSPHKESCD